MSIWTQVFLVNIVLYASSVIWFGMFVSDSRMIFGKLIDSKWYDVPLGIWWGISLLSIPVWLIYLVVA